MNQPLRTVLLHGGTIAGGIVLALVLSGKIGAEVLHRSAPPDGYVVARSVHTTVYAPSAEAAREGLEEIRSARDRFLRTFGTEPGGLVVMLAADPAEYRTLDVAPLYRRGTAFLPFVTRAHLDSRAVGETPDPLLGIHGPDGAEPGAGIGVTVSGANPLHRAPADRLTQVKPLAHEACHIYVAGHADRAVGGGYARLDLPEWLTESAATLCESPEGREVRRRYFRENVERRIPLREFARMAHPLNAVMIPRDSDGRSASGYEVRVVTDPQIRRRVTGTNTILFYAQALALGEFVSERGGPGAMGALVRQAAEGRTLEESLRHAQASAPGLPATLEELETEWIRWVVAQGVE